MEYELEHHMKKLKTLYNCLGPNIIGSIDATVGVFHRAMVLPHHEVAHEKKKIVDRLSTGPPKNINSSRVYCR